MRISQYSVKSVLAEATLAALLGTSATMACGQLRGGAPAAPSSSSDTLDTTRQNSDMLHPRHNVADQVFVKAGLERNVADLQLCQLVQSKSQSEDVKSLAQQITGTRTSLDSQLKTLAKEIDVSVPKNPNKKDKQGIAKIEALSGADFDQQFLQAVGRSFHQDVKDFQSEVTYAQEPLVKQVAQPDADVLSKQLAAIQKVAQAHNVTLDEK